MKPSKTRDITYLNVNIRKSIEDDILKPSYSHGVYGGGFFSIPRSVFCCIDYLGYIACGYRYDNGDINHTR